MYSKRFVQILFVALSILIATRASWFHHDVQARQLSSSGVEDDDLVTTSNDTSAPSTSSDASTTSDAETTSSAPPTTSSDEPSSTSDQITTSDTPTPTTTPTTSNSPPSTTSSNTGPITSTPTSDSTTSASSTASGDGDDSNTETSEDTKSTKSTILTPVTKTSTVFYTSTDGSGQTVVGSSESVVVFSTPGFSGSDGSNNSNPGVTPAQRNIIIGVTVGVGGAIILAAAGILFWRLRNKRRNQDENEELISYGAGFGGPGTAEKSEASGPSAAGTRSPFQSTLETYHAPTQTNAASNF
ncbi:hypothetical protein E0Z10_g3090 [Xylaria hypoxylon]|uniref:Mid2 domain-containing protein n=1 Tax=Xylaria hypoxylon TaxID=37992 RepID=A0A4Z0Z2P6_9PEZI|nr:hypothetical protein E0Z10_g3090 [Xylaria hypoxylon]